MGVDFGKRLKEAEEAGLVGGSDFLKLREGDNRFRLMTECLPHEDTYKGEKNFKWLCYVVDRRDGKLKPFFMPHRIYKQIVALQQSEDYSFEDVPMPYDLTIQAKGAGTKDVAYTLLPARRESPVTADERHALHTAKSLTELQAALREKKGQANGHSAQAPPAADQGEPVDGDDIPF